MNYVFISPHFPANFTNFAVQLAAKGIRVLGIGSEPYAQLDTSLVQALTEYYWVEDMEDYEQMLKACAFFTFKYGKLDRLESHNEHWLYLDACLRTDFNIFGYKKDQMDKLKRKSEMKKVFSDLGIPVARGRLVANLTEAQKFVDLVGFPVCIKPDIGVGASNTFKLNNSAELEWFYQSNFPGEYIIEEFIEGDIVTFDGLTDRYGQTFFLNSFAYSNGIMEVVNQNLDIYYYNRVEIPEDLLGYGLAIVEAFEVKERFFHLEFFRQADGRLVALEANLRPPGGLSMDMFNYSTDTNLYEIYARLVRGDKVPAIERQKYAVVYVGRKQGGGVEHLHEIGEAYDRYGEYFVYSGPIASVFAPAIGNYGNILRAGDWAQLEEPIDYLLARK